MAPKKGHVPTHVKGQRDLFGGRVNDAPLPAALLTPAESAMWRQQKHHARATRYALAKRAAGKRKGKSGGMDWGRVCMLSWGW